MPRAKSETPAGSAEAAWRALSWDDLEAWAGEKALERGKNYQAEGRVTDLALTEEGGLLASVEGTEEYATHAWLESRGKRFVLESHCSCPVGYACKHAVAVVVEYLKALAEKREIPTALEDDPRWYDLDVPEDEDEGYDEPEDRPQKSAKATKEWDEKVRDHLRNLPQAELAELAWGLVRKSPRDYEAIREKVALAELDPKGLVAEARREIRETTAVQPWRNHWDGGGELPDYRPTRRLLERLLELGRADDVVSLGRDLIRKGFAQVGRADDEGETIDRLARCLPVVFEAVARSSLSPPERLLFAIDAELADQTDMVAEASEAVFESPLTPEDWSAAADALLKRIKGRTVAGTDDFSDRWNRDQLTGWIARALEEAGRRDELAALYEAEARLTGSYERLVAFLADEGRLDDAERRATEGIAAVIAAAPGTASHLAVWLRDLAARRGRWDVVAAHAARTFFDHPGVVPYDDLIEAAAKAGVAEPVRAWARRFLETGERPYRVVVPKAAAKASRSRAKAAPKSSRPAEEAPSTPSVKVDPTWPLPVPEVLIPLLAQPRGFGSTGPRWSVLIDLALAAGEPAEVLRWYDRMRAAEEGTPYPSDSPRLADRVAEAVAATHPDRALAIYRDRLDAQLPHTDPSAYAACADYLDRMGPIYRAQGRMPEWSALVASIREKYRNRPRFMEQLDRTLGRAPAK
ncbi:SWIM zinc finger family protein [Paludisphaera soli]|uniref:SWIM zinc finger family protein n=1 Tax=Paludisphaera soli TaxID=2712865 RepID=UPI0013EAE419|nr:SWIM zinc finger family protein [Paludisphaera soli]